MKTRRFLCTTVFLLGGILNLQAQSSKLATPEVKGHIGELATVCGRVVGVRYAESSKGQPTFIDLDGPYPKQAFTIVIWGENRQKFGNPESKYRGKNVCVTAKITEHRGAPEAVATEPGQIKIQ